LTTATFEPVIATTARAALAFDDDIVAAIGLVAIVQSDAAAIGLAGIVRVGAAAFVVVGIQATVAAHAKRATAPAGAVATGAALTAATFEPVGAFPFATAGAVFDDHATLLTATGGAIGAALAGRIAPVVVRAAKLFAIAMPETAGTVAAF
jgi:hypothetical protein